MSYEQNVLESNALMRDLARLLANRKYEFSDDGLMVFGNDVKMSIGGVFDTGASRTEAVQRALDDGDPEKAWSLRGQEGPRVRFGQELSPNIVPTVGLNHIIDVVLAGGTQAVTWYYGAFMSMWSPAPTAGSNWAGSSSGPLATELTALQGDIVARPAATFGTPASGGQITTSALATITLSSTVVTGLTWYGTTLNNIADIGYNASDKILLSAATRDEAMTGLLYGDGLHLGYIFGATST